MTHDDLAALRPDTPQWIDLRGVLFSGRSEVFTNPDPATGFLARALDFGAAFAAGEPSAAVVERTVAAASASDGGAGEWHMLAAPESVEAVGRALGDWRRRGVTLHARGEEPTTDVSDPAGAALSLAPDGWVAAGLDLDHLPEDLTLDYHTALTRSRPMVAALVDDRPVSFCYVAVETESLWDVAIDTLPAYRRRGLGVACFERLAWHMRGQGRSPVWGALDENTASMKLAARLGFRPAARLTSFVRPRAALKDRER